MDYRMASARFLHVRKATWRPCCPAGNARFTKNLAIRALICCVTIAATAVPPALAVTPESPEVRAMIERGLAYLEKETNDELGGKALIALAFHKAGRPDSHPRIQEALTACQTMLDKTSQDAAIYSKAIATIFLMETGSDPALAMRYVGMMREHQKAHGGFSYIPYKTGDTSQTQYAALTFWELLNTGTSPDPKSVQDCLNWLIRTQDPSGVWGYQGQDPGNYELVKQESQPGLSMAAAGMGGVLILGNAVGLLQPPGQVEAEQQQSELPAALRRADEAQKKRAPTLPAGNVDRQRLLECVKRGQGWFDKNFSVDSNTEHKSYYLYSLERYKSFEEYIAGEINEEPEWYQQGYEFLKKNQKEDGSWNDRDGAPCSTAFAILFLLRSTQQTIKASLGEGTLVGGRGLPRDLSKVRLKGGKLVVESKPTEVDQLLGMLDDTDSDALDALLDDPAALRVDNVTPKDARRLQQVVRSGAPPARVLAVRALGRMRNLDYVPTLIYAMSDPDRRVVREARNSLRFVSRKFEGFGLSDNFEDAERDRVLVKWKDWYRTVRPNAPPLP
ncbi:MAG: HEAT repeat domain-containing protein [Planctomycetales bacterium]|nr:HEAT repeat domain-containing protein [Planctomycetales bacterium]